MKQSIQKVDSGCIICGDKPKEPQYFVREHEYPDTTDDVFTVQKCSSCGLFFLDPRPADSELAVIYPPNYVAFDLAESADGSKGLSVKSVSTWFERRRIARVLGLSNTSIDTILDIGCGDGSDLDLLRSILGTELKTVGVEVASSAADRARRRGHEVYVDPFPEVEEKLRAEHGRFDLIISKHVIEHVADPKAFLSAIRGLIHDGGTVMIDTPNVDSPLRWLFRSHWGGWHTPRHWFLFNKETLSLLAKQCDFEVTTVINLPINMFWVWSLHSVFYNKFPKFVDFAFNPRIAGATNLRSVLILGVFQALEVLLKIFSRQTGALRIVLRPSQ